MPLPPQLEQPLNEVVNHLYNLQTAAGGGLKRFYSAIFRDLPDRDEYPDYYLVIKEPRCLHGIMVRPSPSLRPLSGRRQSPAGAVVCCARGRLVGRDVSSCLTTADTGFLALQESMRRGSYSSAQAVAIDLFLIWSNAREYNEQGSMVYADADKLEVSTGHLRF